MKRPAPRFDPEALRAEAAIAASSAASPVSATAEEQAAWLAGLRERHARKRNLMKRLG